MNKFFLILIIFLTINAKGQELYVYSEPASNMPANSISLKLTDHFVAKNERYSRSTHRFMPQLMWGVNKNWMVHIGATFANMHTADFKYESVNLYAKYRFLSDDEIHKHFRMAVFADASITEAPFHYDEITLMGDKSGVEAGLIATQLWHKLAVSATVSHTQVLDESRNNKVIYVPSRNYQAMNYSFSAGYLLLPKEYTDYKQMNLNLYTELLAQQTLDRKTHYVDVAPALQFIFNSNFKVNIGYRFQVSGNMDRMSADSWQLNLERTFLKAFKKK
ncbi:hypothetical protein CAP36_13860 [Chitinophagaceae bacterium IBVUCB2]|nr:hypothetical protein CAP36_13860 [Chitinophagaceae bacterium IBVUCB2]